MTLGSYLRAGGAASEETDQRCREDFQRRLERQLRRWLSPQQLYFDRIDISEECTNYPRREWPLAALSNSYTSGSHSNSNPMDVVS